MYKVYLGPRFIFGMADPVNNLYIRMTERSWVMLEHIGKCIIWGKDYHSYDHWVHEEISAYVNEIARKKTKTPLKVKLVHKNFFERFGNDVEDAMNALWDVYEDSQRLADPYPEVDITWDKGKKFFKAYNEIADAVSKYLATHKYKPIREGNRADYRDEIDPIIYDILNKYC